MAALIKPACLPRLLLAVVASVPGIVLAASSCPKADPEALQWLDKMSRSAHTAYHGVVTLQRGEDMQVMQISHSITGDSSSEQLTKLTGQGAQVVRQGHPLNCLHTGHRLLQLGASMDAGDCGVSRYYRFRLPRASASPDGVRLAFWLSRGICTAMATQWSWTRKPVCC